MLDPERMDERSECSESEDNEEEIHDVSTARVPLCGGSGGAECSGGGVEDDGAGVLLFIQQWPWQIGSKACG